MLALQAFGRGLGGPESARWVALFQALLTGWVVYVGAGGLLYDGIAALAGHGRVAASLLVGLVAAVLYLFSLWRSVATFASGAAPHTCYHLVILLIAAWSGINWLRLAQKKRANAQ